MSSSDHPVLYIVGPTAAGKTRLGIDLAQRFAGEIINADSRQVYLHMDIGTAKASEEEQRQAPHHLLNLLPPDEDFSLGMFLSLAGQAIREIEGRGKLPVVVGGTGQYIWALREGWNVPEVPPDADFRSRLEEEAAREGSAYLYRRLQEVDPNRAREIAPQNLRRIIRALEVHHLTGNAPSSYGRDSTRETPGLMLGITMDRQRLYGRIDHRVDQMMEKGLQAEAQRISNMGYSLGKGPLDSPGYRELGQHFAGELSLQEAVQRTKFQTHRLARRQYTWFKPTDSRINWLEGEAPDLTSTACDITANWLTS